MNGKQIGELKLVYGNSWAKAVELLITQERFVDVILALGKAGVSGWDVSEYLEVVRKIAPMINCNDYNTDAMVKIADYVASVATATRCDVEMVPGVLSWSLTLAGWKSD